MVVEMTIQELREYIRFMTDDEILDDPDESAGSGEEDV